MGTGLAVLRIPEERRSVTEGDTVCYHRYPVYYTCGAVSHGIRHYSVFVRSMSRAERN